MLRKTHLFYRLVISLRLVPFLSYFCFWWHSKSLYSLFKQKISQRLLPKFLLWFSLLLSLRLPGRFDVDQQYTPRDWRRWKGQASEQKQLKSVKGKMTDQSEVSSDKEKLNMWALNILCSGMGFTQHTWQKQCLPFSRVILTNTFLFSYSCLLLGSTLQAGLNELMVELTTVVHGYRGQQQHNTSGQWKTILFLRKITFGLCECGENKTKIFFFPLNILHVVKDCSPTKNSQMTLDFRLCLFCFHISLHKFWHHQKSI